MSDDHVSGRQAVEAMLERAARRVRQLLARRGRLDARIQAVLELAASESVEVDRVLPEALDRLADGGVHQGVVARVSPSQLWSEAILGHLMDKLAGGPCLLAHDGGTDPHKLGACLRTARAARGQAVS